MWQAPEETTVRNLSAQQAMSFVRTAYAIADTINSRLCYGCRRRRGRGVVSHGASAMSVACWRAWCSAAGSSGWSV
jgi:hypothetical protein